MSHSRRFAPLLAAWALCACGSEAPVAEPPAPRASSVLLVTLDTTRADALGAYGQHRPVSPAFDRLAADGVLFEQVTATNPETLPSHASILTGLWPFRHGVRGNAGYELADRHTTLAEALRTRGLATGVEVASMVLRERTRITQGFDHYQGVESPGIEPLEIQAGGQTLEQPIRLGEDISDAGIAFLERNAGSPFFLWLHYFDAHQPYSAPPAYRERAPDSPYHAGIAYQDDQLGRVLDALDRLGLADETIVAVTADHGEGLGEHGEPSHAYFVYETTMRVPLVIAGPGVPQGRRVRDPVRTIDIAPTLLDLLGAPALADTDGRSLRPLIDDADTSLGLVGYGDATHFHSVFGLPPLRSVREGRWKYIHKVNPELYDLDADPSERDDRHAAEPDRAARLRSQLETLVADAPDDVDDAVATLDDETRAALGALGYVADVPRTADAAALRSLELTGEDPNTLIDDIQLLVTLAPALRYGKHALVLDELAPLLARYPDNPRVLGLQGDALVGLGRDDEARDVLERLMRIDPSSLDGRVALSTVYKRAGESDRAIAVLRSLVADDPCAKRPQLRLNQLLYDLRRFEEQHAAVAAGAANCPGMALNLNNYAWVLATSPRKDLRDGAEAVSIMQKLIAREASPNPSYGDTLAAALAEAGRFEDAIGTQERTIAMLRAAGAPADRVERAERRLEAYRAGRPVRDPAT